MINSCTPEVTAIALSLMEGLACPRSLTVAILMRHGDWVQLSELRTDPHQYEDSESYWAASAATDFLRKFSGLPTGIDTEKVAITKWYEAEKACFVTNHRLAPYLDGSLWESADPRLTEFIGKVRKEVRLLIGNCPPDLLQGKFGPGATLSDPSRFTTVNDKMSSVPTLTHNAWNHLIPWIGTEWGRASAALCGKLDWVRGNHFFTVPKDATTDRACAKEPSINGFYQAACGKVMKRRLSRGGINLKDGKRIHAQAARESSIDGSRCTLDLSQASDTIATTLVKLLLPNSWWDLLDSLRSPYTFIEGKWVRLEKFSSMGNGFTFELETVLFCAISRAAAKQPDVVLTYGDDIIVASEDIDEVIAALRWFGFTPNKRKTFTSGNFRESCGGDFFNGIAVRPHFLKDDLNEPQDYISLANGLRRLALQEPGASDRWCRVRRAWFVCLDNIPKHIRDLRGPEALGDLVIHDIEEKWQQRWRHSIGWVKCYRPARFRKVIWERFAYSIQFAGALYLAGTGGLSRDSGGNLSPRDNVLGYKVGWTPFS